MKGIAKAVVNDDQIGMQAAVERETLLFAVMQNIKSHASDTVLDVSTAVLVTINRPEGIKPIVHIYTGEEYDKLVAEGVYDRLREQFEIPSIDVIDGRWFTSKGTLRAAERIRRETAAAEAAAPIVAQVISEQ